MLSAIKEVENFDLYQLLKITIELYSEKNAIHLYYN